MLPMPNHETRHCPGEWEIDHAKAHESKIIAFTIKDGNGCAVDLSTILPPTYTAEYILKEAFWSGATVKKPLTIVDATKGQVMVSLDPAELMYPGVYLSEAVFYEGGVPTYAATNLPPGLSLDSTTGIIYGVPNTQGSWDVGVSATTPNGTGSAVVKFVILQTATAPTFPVLINSAAAGGLTGQDFRFQIATSGGLQGGYTIDVIPSGLAFDGTTGLLWGVVAFSGTYTSHVTAYGATSITVLLTTVFTPTASNVPLISSPILAVGNVNVGFNYKITAVYVAPRVYSSFRYLEVAPTLSQMMQGPPSIAEIRMVLRDTCPEQNTLIDDVEFSDTEIAMALRRTIDIWNETPPALEVYTPATFPWREVLIQGCIALLMKSAAIWFRRNHLEYSAGAVAVNDRNKFTSYEQVGEMYMQKYMDWVRNKKIEINVNSGYGQIGSAFGYRTYYHKSW